MAKKDIKLSELPEEVTRDYIEYKHQHDKKNPIWTIAA